MIIMVENYKKNKKLLAIENIDKTKIAKVIKMSSFINFGSNHS